MEAKKGSAKKIAFLVILILVVALAVLGYVVKDRDRKAPNRIIAAGDTAPDFSLPALDGRRVSLSGLRGKVVMVHFWATWCPPCVEEIPTLAKLYPELSGNDFAMLAISVDEGGAPAVSAFLRKNGLALPVLLDPGAQVSHSYGTFKYPETYILDRQGVVRHKVIGPADWRDPAAIEFIRKLIAAQ